MGQIWAQAAAWHFGLNDVRTFSGGTEAEAATYRARALQIGAEAFYVKARAAELRAQ